MSTWIPDLLRPKLADTLVGYTRAQLASDVSAGLTVGVLALPLAMAFAIASGMTPASGLWTAIVAGFLISALGGSKVQIGGPTGAFIPIIYGLIVSYGVPNLLVATFIAGALLVAMGLFRLGHLIRFIPITVVIGFTNGIAVIIFIAQIKDFLGLSIDHMPGEFFGKVRALTGAIGTVDPATVAVATASLGVLLGWNALAARVGWMRRLPGPLAVLVLATVANALWSLPIDTIGSRFNGIPQGLPAFGAPALSLETVGKLIAPAITIAILGAIESLLSARVADGQIDDRHDPNQELVAQGVANLVVPFVGGFAATGAIARTATNIRSGGRTPVAGIVHALTLLAIVLAAAPVAAYVPLATLSAIVVVVAFNMGEWHEFLHLRRYSVPYRATLITTFLLTVLFDLTLAVEVGLVLASLFFIYRMQDLTRVELISAAQLPGANLLRPDGTARVAVYRLYGTLFFGAVGKLEGLLEIAADHPDVVVLDMEKVISIDNTGLDTLRTLGRVLSKRGKKLILCDLNQQPKAMVQRGGLWAELGPRSVCETVDDALAQTAATVAGETGAIQ